MFQILFAMMLESCSWLAQIQQKKNCSKQMDWYSTVQYSTLQLVKQLSQPQAIQAGFLLNLC